MLFDVYYRLFVFFYIKFGLDFSFVDYRIFNEYILWKWNVKIMIRKIYDIYLFKEESYKFE